MPEFHNVTINGPWKRAEVHSFLSQAIIPIRLAVLNDDAWPLVVSLWFMPQDDALWCATNDEALIVRYLRGNARCAFEVAGDTPPYKGIRGQGRASIIPEKGAAVLETLLARYSIKPDSRLSQTLLAKVDREVAIRIEPEWLTSWDFTSRMRNAVAQPQ